MAQSRPFELSKKRFFPRSLSFCNSISIRSALLVFTVIGLPIVARLHMQAPRGRNIRQRLNASIYANLLRRKGDCVSDFAGVLYFSPHGSMILRSSPTLSSFDTAGSVNAISLLGHIKQVITGPLRHYSVHHYMYPHRNPFYRRSL